MQKKGGHRPVSWGSSQSTEEMGISYKHSSKMQNYNCDWYQRKYKELGESKMG